MSLLNVQNLSVDIGDLTVLDSISFDLKSGDILALTGESGSGSNCISASAVMDLPDPLSPVRARISPDPSAKLMVSRTDISPI